jgi:hypothetical protein
VAGSLRAADAKNRKAARIPLRADLVEDIRAWLARKLEGAQAAARKSGEAVPSRPALEAPLFRVPKGLRRILEGELAAAGFPYESPGGFAELHALLTRSCRVTNLARSGVHPKSMQGLARHSTVTLTLDRYSHLELVDLEAAVKALPRLMPPPKGAEPARATGTDGKRATDDAAGRPSVLTGQLTGNFDVSSQPGSAPDTGAAVERQTADARKSLSGQELSTAEQLLTSDGNGIPDRIRTCGLRLD